MDRSERDRDVIECLDIIYELSPDRHDRTGSPDTMPSLAESREALRSFAQIPSLDLRTAVRMLLRTLAMPVTSADPSAPPPSAASRLN